VKILVNGATASLRQHPRPFFGVLISPRQRGTPERNLWPGCVWAADNDAFSGFDPEAFISMLAQYADHRASCRFVAVPDVVADAAATRARFDRWSPVVATHGYPLAFVAQDGLTIAACPWEQFDALFIGGSTAFKLGPEARQLVGWAKALGKWVHMGRVNSARRLRYAEMIGCDSVDGSGFSRFPDEMRGRADRWYSQPSMPLGDVDARA
jgi:hypothetical protein